MMASYEDNKALATFNVKEFSLFGSSREGLLNNPITGNFNNLINIGNNQYQYNYKKGFKGFDLSNQLGNVLAVVSDRKIANDVGQNGTTDYFEAEVLSVTDYYAFGSPMPGRLFNGNQYRFGFNQQEKVDEIGNGHYTAEFWEYDSRLAKRWNIDPVIKESESPYAVFGNNPILLVDQNGADAGTQLVNNGDGTGQANINTTVYLVRAPGITPNQFQNYVNGYAARIQNAYNGRTFNKDGVDYTVNVSVTVVVAPNVKAAQKMMKQAGGVGTSNILTVGLRDPNPGENPLNLLINASKVYGSGNQGFANINQSGQDPHEFGHLLGLDDRYHYYVNVQNYNEGLLASQGQASGTAPRWLPEEYDTDYNNNRAGNMMSIGGATGVLTNQQFTFIFSHGANVTPGSGEKENFGTLRTYFFKNSNGTVPGILGSPGGSYLGTYKPGLIPRFTGEGRSLRRQHRGTVDFLYNR
jgi:hypothetical protein